MKLSRQGAITLWLSIPILLGGYALLIWRLNAESVWHDEGWSIRAIRGPFETPDDNTPYVYYTLGHLLWRAGFGETPFGLRFISVLIAWIGMALALRIGRGWFGVAGGLTEGILVTSSPLLWEYGQEVRAYVGVPLIALGLAWLVDQLLSTQNHTFKSPRYALWSGLFALQFIGIYTHNLVVPLVVWVNIVVGSVWLARWDWRRMIIWAGIEIALIVAYIPWLMTQSPSGTPLNSPPQLNFGLPIQVWQAYFLPVQSQFEENTILHTTDLGVAIGFLFLMALIACIILLLFEFSSRHWILVSHVTLVPVLTSILLIVAHIDFHPRYYIASVPLSLLLLVAGIEAFTRQQKSAVVIRYVGYGILLAGCGWISYTSITMIADTRTYQHDDFEGLARYYATLPEDAVILVPFNREPALQDYYAEKFDIRAQFVNVELYADADTALAEINKMLGDKSRYIEFLTWYQLPADVRGMYPCLLSGGSTETNAPRFFYGLSTQSYRIENSFVFQSLSAQPNYQEITFLQGRWLSSPSGVCIETEWQLEHSQAHDLKIAMEIVNPWNDPIARSDTPIATSDQVETAAWNEDGTGQAYSLLQLVEGAPLTEYPIAWTVYTAQQRQGLELFDINGSSLGRIYRLSQPIIAQGLPLVDAPSRSELKRDNTENTYRIKNNQALEVTVLLAELESDAPRVRLTGENWEIERIAIYEGKPVLNWYEFRFTSEMTGMATLWIDDLSIAEYFIEPAAQLLTIPAYDIPVGIHFPSVGELVGVSIKENVRQGEPFSVELVWRAENATEIPYTVFIQLLPIDLTPPPLAQSDSIPVQGTRPTTGWQAGEYMVDSHQLRWNEAVYHSQTKLIIGLYNPETFQRVLTDENKDFAEVNVEISVREEN